MKKNQPNDIKIFKYTSFSVLSWNISALGCGYNIPWHFLRIWGHMGQYWPKYQPTNKHQRREKHEHRKTSKLWWKCLRPFSDQNKPLDGKIKRKTCTCSWGRTFTWWKPHNRIFTRSHVIQVQRSAISRKGGSKVFLWERFWEMAHNGPKTLFRAFQDPDSVFQWNSVLKTGK